jgi:hypothetical protein
VKNRFMVCRDLEIPKYHAVYDRLKKSYYHTSFKKRADARYVRRKLEVKARRASMHIVTEGFCFSRPVVRNFKLIEGIAS